VEAAAEARKSVEVGQKIDLVAYGLEKLRQ
jgi:hypothetical protein